MAQQLSPNPSIQPSKSSPASPSPPAAPPNSGPTSQPNGINSVQLNGATNEAEFFREIRGSLMVVAVLAAGATYTAGLNPPGGFWQANDNFGHVAGDPVLHDTLDHRYTAFFYCNATSFITSLVIIILLMNNKICNDTKMIKVLQITMVLDLFGFMGAYAAGSCRKLSSSIYLFLLMGGVFVYVLSFARHYHVVQKMADRTPCLKPVLGDNNV